MDNLPPNRRFTQLFQMELNGQCDFQMDWHIKQLQLKYTHPLYNILITPTTEGVGVSFGSV